MMMRIDSNVDDDDINNWGDDDDGDGKDDYR